MYLQRVVTPVHADSYEATQSKFVNPYPTLHMRAQDNYAAVQVTIVPGMCLSMQVMIVCSHSTITTCN